MSEYTVKTWKQFVNGTEKWDTEYNGNSLIKALFILWKKSKRYGLVELKCKSFS